MSDLLLQKHNHDDFNLNDEFGQLYKWYNKDPLCQTTSVSSTSTLSTLHAGLVFGDTSGGAVTSTLPAAAGNLGLTYTLKLDDDTNNWTIARAGTDTIDGATSKVLSVDNETITIRSDGVSKWRVIYSSIDYSEIGVYKPYGGTTAPSGYLLCDGSAVSRTKYSRLFAVIGEANGEGNGTTTFNLPLTDGKFIRGVAHGSANDPDRATRTAAATGGNTGDNVGSVQADAFKWHRHPVAPSTSATNDYLGGSNADYGLKAGGDGGSLTCVVGRTGGNETRPINLYSEFIIKY